VLVLAYLFVVRVREDEGNDLDVVPSRPTMDPSVRRHVVVTPDLTERILGTAGTGTGTRPASTGADDRTQALPVIEGGTGPDDRTQAVPVVDLAAVPPSEPSEPSETSELDLDAPTTRTVRSHGSDDPVDTPASAEAKARLRRRRSR
jgi:hypothetical protein